MDFFSALGEGLIHLALLDDDATARLKAEVSALPDASIAPHARGVLWTSRVLLPIAAFLLALALLPAAGVAAFLAFAYGWMAAAAAGLGTLLLVVPLWKVRCAAESAIHRWVLRRAALEVGAVGRSSVAVSARP
jgi:hypothetical protein